MQAAIAAGVAALVTVAVAAAPARAEGPAAPPPTTPAPTPATAAETATATATVTAWLDAQNRGDFTAYQVRYAEVFTGVRRVGTTTKRFDRAGWMKDRKAMFRAKMTVTATGVRVTRAGDRLVVELEQRWEQGAYADVGAKRLELDPATGEITSEELLASRVVPTAAACKKALFADGARGRTGPDAGDDAITTAAAIDLGASVHVCRVDHAAPGAPESTVELAAVVRKKAWSTVGERVVIELRNATQGDQSETGTVTLTALDLGAPAIAVEVAAGEVQPMVEDRKTETTVYLVAAAGLVAQLAFESTTHDDAEDSTGTRCALATGAGSRKGHRDLEVTCTTTAAGDWWNEDAAKRGRPADTAVVTRYRWNGTIYEER